MRRSTIVFCHVNTTGTYILQSQDLPMVDTYPQVADSVILSLAAYMTWKFPSLRPPHKPSTKHQQLIYPQRPMLFPNYQCKLHPRYYEWTGPLIDAVEKGNALRDGEDCYFKVEVDSQYVDELISKGFQMSDPSMQFKWELVREGLEEIYNSSNKCQAQSIAFVSCANQHEQNLPPVDIRSYFYGIYFANNKWTSYDVLRHQLPTIEQLKNVSTIVIPGSNLSVYDRRPEVVTFTQKLRCLINQHKSPVKILGICFGHQLLSDIFGGEIKCSGADTRGATKISLHQDKLQNLKFDFLNPLRGLNSLIIHENHGDEVTQIPNKFHAISSSERCKHQMIVSECGKYLGIQCHPEYSVKETITYNIQLAHHLHKEKAAPFIEQLLKKLNTDVKDEHSHVLRNVIHKFIS